MEIIQPHASSLTRPALSTSPPGTMRRPALLAPLRPSKRTLSTSPNFEKIREELLKRPLNLIEDYLSPTNSRLLSLTLSEFLPPASQATPYGLEEKAYYQYLFPQGHHLVYFPTHTPLSQLLPDGTDVLHSPGAPFVRRMWAGGSVQFSTDPRCVFLGILGRARRATCVEGIRDVRVRGPPNEEKIFVDIERQYRTTGIYQPPRLLDVGQGKEKFRRSVPADITEKRTLVFMRSEQAPREERRFVKSPGDPEFNMELTPTPSLLFRFSALTFNAHQIHLSSQYASQVEGLRDMVVHGPLSLVLILSLLKSQLGYKELVSSFSYRNLAPLYVNEMMKVCGKRSPDGTCLMWIEDSRGSLAVRGEATIAKMEKPDSKSEPSFAKEKHPPVSTPVSTSQPTPQLNPQRAIYRGVISERPRILRTPTTSPRIEASHNHFYNKLKLRQIRRRIAVLLYYRSRLRTIRRNPLRAAKKRPLIHRCTPSVNRLRARIKKILTSFRKRLGPVPVLHVPGLPRRRFSWKRGPVPRFVWNSRRPWRGLTWEGKFQRARLRLRMNSRRARVRARALAMREGDEVREEEEKKKRERREDLALADDLGGLFGDR